MVRLAIERRSRGWTQADLGRQSEVHPNTISLIESGRFKPSAQQLEKLRAALGVRPSDAPKLLEIVEVETLPTCAAAR